MSKPLLCLDFDGVLHSYTSGWKGIDVVTDPPVPGAIAFLNAALDHFRVGIYSSRSKETAGILAMQNFLAINGAKVSELEWWSVKPPAFLTIDDRCIPFEGTFPENPKDLLKFQPWNKRT